MVCPGDGWFALGMEVAVPVPGCGGRSGLRACQRDDTESGGGRGGGGGGGGGGDGGEGSGLRSVCNNISGLMESMCLFFFTHIQTKQTKQKQLKQSNDDDVVEDEDYHHHHRILHLFHLLH